MELVTPLSERFHGAVIRDVQRFCLALEQHTASMTTLERAFYCDLILTFTEQGDLTKADFDTIANRENKLLQDMYNSIRPETHNTIDTDVKKAYCHICKKEQANFTYMKQTRSIDEPMTRFRVCLVCGKNTKTATQ